ncbi:hypothetical protein F5B18DRAFT_656116 [Nemania serpens]|nr:hypothetical protein F5B18DRAFT_656116 [Nemania serpens]
MDQEMADNNGQSNSGQSNNQSNNGQSNNGQSDNGQSNNGQSNNGQSDNNQSNNSQSNNSQSDNGQSNNGQSDNSIKIEGGGFEDILGSTPPAPAPPSSNWGTATFERLESTPFPEPAHGGEDEDYDFIMLPRDPDIKGRKVPVDGRIYCILGFRDLLVVLVPSLTEEQDHCRAVLVKSADAPVEKARFVANNPNRMYTSKGTDLAGCDWEDFEVMCVATDSNKSVTFCIGCPRGAKNKNVYSKSILDSRFGKKNVDILLNTHRELVGQGKIPRNKVGKRVDNDDEAHREYVEKMFKKWDGTPPPMIEV